MYADEIEVDEKELEHSSLQEKLGMELKELDKKLEQKEVKFVCSCNVAIRPCSVFAENCLSYCLMTGNCFL